MSEYEVYVTSEGYGCNRKEEVFNFDSQEKAMMFVANEKKNYEKLSKNTGGTLNIEFKNADFEGGEGNLLVEVQIDDGNPREEIAITVVEDSWGTLLLSWDDVDEYIKNRPYYHEKEVWERVRDDFFSDDHTTYAMESVWNALFSENTTAEEIRKSNLKTVEGMLGPENTDEVLKHARYLFPYVYEIKGAPSYVAGITQSNESQEAYIEKYRPVHHLKRNTIWDQSDYKNDLPREGNCYTIDEMAFYNKENALSWLEERGFSEDEVLDYTSDILEDMER